MNASKNYWPHGIVLTFVLFIGGTVALIVIACSHPTDLITADYYADELKFQTRLDQLNRTAELSDRVNVAYDASTDCIHISLPAETGGGPVAGRIQLYRPSATDQDRVVPLTVDAQGAQVLDAAALGAGLWKVRVQWQVKERDYFADRSIVVKRGA
jgi:hypothetical protein